MSPAIQVLTREIKAARVPGVRAYLAALLKEIAALEALAKEGR